MVEAKAEELVEISIAVLSGEIPNMTVESLHEVSGETRAQLVITAVNNVTGIDLLREERCGSERNGLPGDLQSSSRSRYVNNTFVQVPVVQALRQIPEVVLQVGEVVGDPGFIELLRLHGHLHHVPVPVEPLALPPVVAKGMCGIVVRLNAYGIHPLLVPLRPADRAP